MDNALKNITLCADIVDNFFLNIFHYIWDTPCTFFNIVFFSWFTHMGGIRLLVIPDLTVSLNFCSWSLKWNEKITANQES